MEQSPVQTSADWDIRPYQPGDETQLTALFEQVFGRPIGLDGWRWKLKGLPAPVENVWVAVAAEDGRVIGQYAGIPVQVKLAGAVYPAMVSVDTMTAPDFRRRGILTALGKAIYASWATAGVKCVLGLPNQQWGSRTDALGWTTLFPLVWRRAPLHVEQALAAHAPRPLAGSIRALGGAGMTAWQMGRHQLHHYRGVQVERVISATEELDHLWEQLNTRYESLLVRDRRWVAWRYLEAAGISYTVLTAQVGDRSTGYVAYKLIGGQDRHTGFIADLFTAPDDQASAGALLTAALDDLWARRAETVRVTATPGTPLDAAVQAAGFRPTEGAFDFEIVPLPSCPDPILLRDPVRWLLTGGDFDVV